MPIKIVTDSLCDLPESVVRENDINVIPCYVNAGGHSYLDGIELSRQEFYRRLPGYRTPPTTSAPGLGTFIQTYRQVIQQGATGIISLHVAGNFSNLIEVARLASNEVNEVPVTIIDTGTLSLGEGLQALAAAEATREGCSPETIVAMTADMARRTTIFAVLDTIEYLRRSGRASFLQASLGAWLDIKPVLTVHQGQVSLERTRTQHKALALMLARVDELGPLEKVAMLHTHAPEERMAALAQLTRERYRLDGRLLTAEVTPAIGTHVGPAAMGLVVVKARLS